MHPGQLGPQVGQVGEPLPEVFEPGREQVVLDRAVTADRQMPTDTAAEPSWNHGRPTLTIALEPVPLAADPVGGRDR